MSETEREHSKVRSHLPALGGYTVLTGLVLWPAVVRFRSAAMIDGVDGTMFTWLWWLMPRAIREGHNPFRTDLVFHPVGADLTLTTSAPLVSLVTWPVQAVLGPEAQVNTVQLGSMLLAGFGCYLLALHVCGQRWPSFVAGAAYALLPARFAHVDSHLNLVETGIIPLALLAFLRLLEEPTRRRVMSLGGWLGAAFLIEPQVAVLILFGLAALGLAQRDVLRERVRQLAASGTIALLVASPLLVPMAIAIASGGEGPAHPTRVSLVYSASPLSWVVPPLDRLWLGHVWSFEPLTPTLEGIAYPGLVVLALAVTGVRLVSADRRRGWVAVAIVGVVLSLGPYPFVRDTSVDLPLPFFVLRAVPGLDSMRVPGRFALLGALGLLVLASLGLARLADRAGSRRAVLSLSLLCLVCLELWPQHLPSRPTESPEVYEAMAVDPAEGAVLELPLKWSTTQHHYGFVGHDQDFLFLLHAMVHERPVVSGAVSRYPQEDLDALLAVPAYRQLLALGGQPGITDRARFTEADLAGLGIAFVVYHRDDPAPEVLAYVERLDLEVLADDGQVIVWRVST